MKTQEELKETIGEIVHHFCRKPKTNDSFWHLFDDEQKGGMYEFVEDAIYVLNLKHAPSRIHYLWLGRKERAGWKQGYPKDPKKKIHPLLVEWEELPPEQRMKLGILYDFTKRVMEYWEEKESLKSEVL